MVRFKHRYLLVHLLFPNSLPNPFLSSLDEEEQQSTAPASPTINEAGLISLLRDSLSVNFGDVGAGEVGGSFASELARFAQSAARRGSEGEEGQG